MIHAQKYTFDIREITVFIYQIKSFSKIERMNRCTKLKLQLIIGTLLSTVCVYQIAKLCERFFKISEMNSHISFPLIYGLLLSLYIDNITARESML